MIYIHIGLQKTGTTSLQYILEKMNLLKHPLDKSRYTNSKEKEFYRFVFLGGARFPYRPDLALIFIRKHSFIPFLKFFIKSLMSLSPN